MEQTFTISDLAREFEVTPRTIRFYEDQSLLQPGRNGQARVYTPRDRVRLGLILRGKRVGFSLAEIKDLLDLYQHNDGQVEQLTATLGKCRDRIGVLKQQRKDIDATVSELEGYCEGLEKMLIEKDFLADGEPA